MSNPNVAFRTNLPPVTKVWNREYAIQRLTAELDLARQEPDYRFSILLVRFDGLLLAGRDRLGFASGNDLAVHVFTVLTQGLAENEVCCHLAADEFLLVLPQRSEAECLELADVLRGRWSPQPGSREATIDLSVGWAASMGAESTIEGLFAAADENLSRAEEAALVKSPLGHVSFDGMSSHAAGGRQGFVGRS